MQFFLWHIQLGLQGSTIYHILIYLHHPTHLHMPNTAAPRFEFIALMALMMSISALATDTLLPALGVIGNHFGVSQTSDKQLLVTMTFLGMGVGQLFAGALSDSMGRKPVMYLGFAIFILASILSVSTQRFDVLVLSRVLQGVGLSAPRTLSTAIVRDGYTGRHMAKTMSFISMIFILVPAIAPTLGSWILHYFGWRAIFYMQISIAALGVLWFALRQAETLPKNQRSHLNIYILTRSSGAFFSQKKSVLYTIALGFAMGALFTFLSTSETIFIAQYQKADAFSYLFAAIALSMGVSMFINGKYVLRYGMYAIVRLAAVFFTCIPLLYVVLFASAKNPSVYVVQVFLMLQIFSIGFIFGNLTALAIEPLGHIAGMASAIVGFVSMLIGVSYAGVIGSFIHTTALPLFVGFFISGLAVLAALAMIQWLETPSQQELL